MQNAGGKDLKSAVFILLPKLIARSWQKIIHGSEEKAKLYSSVLSTPAIGKLITGNLHFYIFCTLLNVKNTDFNLCRIVK